MNKTLIDLPAFGDERGILVSLEAQKSIPFEVKRVYYICKVKEDKPRGFHAHRNLQQLMVCVSGGCDLVLDNGITKQTLRLDDPTKGLVLEGVIWREMHNFTSDCVMLVMSSHHYDENDYIRNYDDFLKEIKK